MFIAGYNIPGYLPDLTPEEFDTAKEAWGYLHDEVRHAQNDTYEDIGYNLLDAVAREILCQEGTGELFGADGYVYWVSPAE